MKPNVRKKPVQTTNFTTSSESIARALIDKIISLALTQHTLHQIEAQLGDYCFSSIQFLMSSYLSLNFIPYDKDDLIDQASILLSQSTISHKENDSIKYALAYNPFTINSYDNCIEGENAWNSIPMPLSTCIDRTATNVNFTVKNEKQDNININLKQQPDCHKIIEEMSVSEEKSSVLPVSPVKTRLMSRLNQREKGEQLKPKKPQPVEFTSFDLPKESARTTDQVEIDDLRFEKLNELKSSEKAKEEMLKKAKEKQETDQKTFNKQKELDKKNITLDAKGNIVEVKKVVLERLIPEFIPISSEQKDLNIISNQSNFDTVHTKGGDSSSNRIMHSKSLLKSKANQVPQLFQNIAKPVIPQAQALGSLQSLEHKFLEQERRPENLVPAGSSFDLMKPEIGVELYEESKYKTGGKDFFRKYKRYSVSNFKEQNETYKSAYTIQKDIMPIIETKSNAQESANSLSEQGSHKENKRRPVIAAAQPPPYSKKDSIQLNTKNSIKNAFDKLDLIFEKEEDYKGDHGKEYQTNTHFFKKRNNPTKRISSAINNKLHDEMTNFNSNIMKNKNWGASGLKKSLGNEFKRYPVKPQMKTIEHEIGVNIAKTKLPRARLFSYIKSPLNDNKVIERTSSAAFFKVVNEDASLKAFAKTSSEKFMTIQPL